jgi:hypothetical protein
MEGQSEAKVLTEKQLKYLGKTFGALTVINLHEIRKSRSYFKCACNRCNFETVVRGDHLLNNPKSCTHCVNGLQKEIAEIKYPQYLRKYNTKFNGYIGNAKTLNRVFELTKEEFISIIKSECIYCGKQEAFGIDRRDNLKGYTLENSVPCCKICNQMKHAFHKDIFLKQVELIYNYQLKQSSTTILKESTSQAYGDGKGENLVIQDCDIV